MKIRTTLPFVAAAILVLSSTSTASATEHQQSPPDGGGYGFVSQTHYYIEVCDRSHNHRGIRMEYTILENPNVQTLGDANGADSPCGTRFLDKEVLSFRVCSRNSGGGGDSCSTWDWIGDH